MNILEINNVSKNYASARALDNISLNIKEGAICGLLGPNGAGKTTLLRIITGLLTYDTGTVTVAGEPASLVTARKIGYMPEERGLYDKMTVENQILYFGRLKGGESVELRKVMDEYLELFNLSQQKKRKIKELSKGNQQKVQIISTIVHNPELVILDEPFSGFDPINGALLEELIDRLHKRGTTIILSSHNMPAVEEICSDIALINSGHILLDGNISDIKESNKSDRIIFTSANKVVGTHLIKSGLASNFEACPPIRGRKGFSYSLIKQPGVRNNDIIDALAIEAEILQFEEALPTLNEIFIKYTIGTDNDNPALN